MYTCVIVNRFFIPLLRESMSHQFIFRYINGAEIDMSSNPTVSDHGRWLGGEEFLTCIIFPSQRIPTQITIDDYDPLKLGILLTVHICHKSCLFKTFLSHILDRTNTTRLVVFYNYFRTIQWIILWLLAWWYIQSGIAPVLVIGSTTMSYARAIFRA